MASTVDIDSLVPLFAGDPRCLALYLLGSANEGRMRSDSDIDLALLLEPDARMDELELIDQAARAAALLGREVDLGLLSSRNLVYSREAIMKGSRIFCRDAGRADQRETALLGMYINFNEERAEVLDAYRA